MDLFPAARRVLLTAYADTEAAIDAINVVDLDHYLLKPWHPPEEKLYPVLDGLLADVGGHARTRPAPRSGWSGTGGRRRRSRSVTSWPATWCRTGGCSPTSRRRARLLERGRADRRGRCRWCSPPRARRWSTPSAAELAANVGLATMPGGRLLRPGGDRRRPGRPRRGGLRRRRRGCAPCWWRRRPPAGRPARARRIENYLGFPDGVSGAQLTDRARRQALKFGAELLSTREVVGLEVAGSARLVRFADGSAIARPRGGAGHRRDRTAGWTRPAWPTSPAAASTTARPSTEAPSCAGEDVYIVGGANSAGQAAVYFARYARAGAPADPRRRPARGRCRST